MLVGKSFADSIEIIPTFVVIEINDAFKGIGLLRETGSSLYVTFKQVLTQENGMVTIRYLVFREMRNLWVGEGIL